MSQEPVFLVCSFVAMGVGVPLTSGADTALISAAVRARGGGAESTELTRALGRYQAICSGSLTLALLAGAVLADLDLRLALFASAAAQVLAAVTILFARDFDHKRRLSGGAAGAAPPPNVFFAIRELVVVIGQSRPLLRLILGLALLDGAFRVGYMFSQEILSQVGVAVALVSVLYAVEALITVVASHQSWRLEERLGARMALLIAVAGATVSFAALGAQTAVLVVVGFLAAGAGSSVLYSTGDAALCARTRPEQQASMLSVVSGGAALTMTLLAPALGIAGELLGLGVAAAVGGVVVCVAAGLLLSAALTSLPTDGPVTPASSSA